MTLVRLAIAMAVTRAAARVAVALVPELEDDNRPAPHPNLGSATTQVVRRLHPVEQILLGSIVGLGICGLWIWIAARAA